MSGYLVDNINITTGIIKYRGIEIKSEILKEYINGDNNLYTYVKYNGVKYYKDPIQNKWFYILNGQRYDDDSKNFEESSRQAERYYSYAQSFKYDLINKGIAELKTSDAVYENGQKKQRDEALNRDVTLAEKLQWRRF